MLWKHTHSQLMTGWTLTKYYLINFIWLARYILTISSQSYPFALKYERHKAKCNLSEKEVQIMHYYGWVILGNMRVWAKNVKLNLPIWWLKLMLWQMIILENLFLGFLQSHSVFPYSVKSFSLLISDMFSNNSKSCRIASC